MEKTVNNDFVKLHRELLSKPIWKASSSQQKVIFVTILLSVNYKEKKWEWKGEPYTCKPGQLIISLSSLAELCGRDVSIQNVRTALARFERLGFLTSETAKEGRLITVVNWEKYQSDEPANDMDEVENNGE